MRAIVAGMSLVELMVAVGIVGLLGAIGMPRYKNFLVQSRRGEAYTNLAHIETLQQTYKAEHADFYRGAADTKGIGYKDGMGNQGDCDDPDTGYIGIANRLGFRPNNCTELRYLYTFGGDTAKASAASDAPERHIYPDCSDYGCNDCGYDYGDALTMPVSTGDISVCRNISKYCPGGGGGCVSQPPPCVCTASTSPSPPNYQPSASTKCQGVSFEQRATVTETWSSTCASYPCPSATTRTLRRAAIGTDTSSIYTNCTEDSKTYGSWALSDATINLNNMYDCQTTTEKRTVTTTYQPPPPQC